MNTLKAYFTTAFRRRKSFYHNSITTNQSSSDKNSFTFNLKTKFYNGQLTMDNWQSIPQRRKVYTNTPNFYLIGFSSLAKFTLANELTKNSKR